MADDGISGVVVGLIVTPGVAAQMGTCIVCEEKLDCLEVPPGPDCQHRFLTDTEEFCAENPDNFACRACGYTSASMSTGSPVRATSRARHRSNSALRPR